MSTAYLDISKPSLYTVFFASDWNLLNLPLSTKMPVFADEVYYNRKKPNGDDVGQ